MTRREPTDNPEALGLEQRCVRPGLWHIEGRIVVRERVGRRDRRRLVWRVYGFDGQPPVLYEAALLNDCRDWIRDGGDR